MNLLDRAISGISPGWGARRALARRRIAALDRVREYEGAKYGRRTDGWVTVGRGSSADAEVGRAMAILRDRGRDLVRNNPWGAKAVKTFKGYAISTGITPRSMTGNKDLDRRVEDGWRRFADQADAEGRTDVYGLMALAANSVFSDGEVLCRARQRRPSDGLRFPIQFQLLEADHIDTSRDSHVVQQGQPFTHLGIRYSAIGQRVAYLLHPTHPGGPSSAGGGARPESQPVPAEFVAHVFEQERPGQTRGVTAFAPALLTARDLADYRDALIMRKEIEACMVASAEFPDAPEPVTGGAVVDGDNKRIETFRPGMILYPPPGGRMTFHSPTSSSGDGEFMRQQLLAIAAAVGLTYELLTGDLTEVNYSSIKAGLNSFQARIEQWQWQVLIPQLCAFMWRWYVDTAVAVGYLPAGADYDVEWSTPRFPSVDLAKEVEGELAAVRGGLWPLPEAIARQGYDPRRVLQEIADFNALADSLGIILDSDPRHTARSGALQKADGAPARPGGQAQPRPRPNGQANGATAPGVQ